LRRASRHLLGGVDAADIAAYRTVTGFPPSPWDRVLTGLSNAGNGGLVWLLISGGLLVFGRRKDGQHRRAAVLGVGALAATSVVVDLVAKPALGRRRPTRIIRPATARVRMPRSASFPSGHSASAFAFAAAVGGEVPVLAIPLCTLATGMAYSRVHAGVHYPTDVVLGSLIGVVTGTVTRRVAHAISRRVR
jgi:undecaprenyl-diphosphatase